MIARPTAGLAADRQRQLARELLGSDEEAFRAFLELQGPRLLAVARRILRHEEDARDALQDALLCVLRALPGFKGDSLPSTWMYRIVVNASLMKLRERRRVHALPLERTLARGAGPSCSGRQPLWSSVREPEPPESGIWRRCAREELRVGLSRLSPPYEAVIRLRYLEELPTEEIACRLGASANAIRIRLHRARRALRTLVAP